MNNIKTILIIDDSKFCIKITGDILKKAGYKILEATTGINGLQIAIKKQPDLIILDLIMPTVDGFETAEQLKKEINSNDIPIIFLTSGDVKLFITDAYQSGGVDYIMKPVNKEELLARVKTQLELRRKTLALKKSHEIIQRKNRELNQLLITDGLTKLYTRSYILEKIKELQENFKINEEEFSVIMLDIDHFKNINDKYGHCCGDFILKKISDLLRSNLRKTDTIARWGGEEFLILLPGTHSTDAYLKAKKLLRSIREKVYTYENNKISTTISFGIATYESNHSIDKIIKAADRKLYQAKNNGRNQICY